MSVIKRGINEFINGDKIIKYVEGKKIRNASGVYDLPTISQWYSEDPERRHLGMMGLFGQMSKNQYMYGIVPDLLKNRQILNVGKDGKFTYDIPIYEDKQCMTVRDTSDQLYPGKDGTTFRIVLSEEFKPGDVLTSDPLYGDDIIVDDESPVTQVGDGWEHIVKFVSNDKEEYYPQSQLAAGITYTKINHSLFGEYDVHYSTVRMPDTSGYYRCEFELGSGRGVEAMITAKADKSFSGAAASTYSKEYLDKLQEEADKMGDIAVLMDLDQRTGKANPKTARLASTIEILVRKELERMNATALMFQKAGRIQGSNGSATLSEGIWHQLRRGKLIKYARPGGMTVAHIKEAVEYIFRENPLPPEEREIVFECGSEMYHNFNTIFRDESVNQLGTNGLGSIPALFGTDGQIPQSPISGGINPKNGVMELETKAVAFRKVHLPGIGNVTAKRNYSLDYITDIDRFSAGFHPYKKNHTTYSAVIWDARSEEYSNNKKLPEGSTLIKGGNPNANMYLVKYEGDIVTSGYEQGRYSPYKSADILSSSKQRGVNYWAYSQVAAWIPDPSAFVMIELDPAGRKGYI